MIGDLHDMLERLRRTLPKSWFPAAPFPTIDPASAVPNAPDDWYGARQPILSAVLSGLADGWAHIYDLIVYARQQTRLLTASGGWLDMIAGDFFALALPRRPSESDDSYRSWIRINLFRERATRPAMEAVIHEFTGSPPTIFEPSRPADVGGGYGLPTAGYGTGPLRYGSITHPAETLIDITVPPGTAPSDVLAVVEATRPAGTRCWVRLHS